MKQLRIKKEMVCLNEVLGGSHLYYWLAIRPMMKEHVAAGMYPPEAGVVLHLRTGLLLHPDAVGWFDLTPPPPMTVSMFNSSSLLLAKETCWTHLLLDRFNYRGMDVKKRNDFFSFHELLRAKTILTYVWEV